MSPDFEKITCFRFQNDISDTLDGTHLGSRKKSADAHLESCATCAARFAHYRRIVAAVSALPRSTLPVAVRHEPLKALLPSWDFTDEADYTLGPSASTARRALERLRARWRRVPWHVRTPAEGAAIVALILIGISSGPRLRGFYESKVEKSLIEFSQTFSDPSSSGNGIPLLRGREALQSLPSDKSGAPGDYGSAGARTEAAGEDEFTSDEADTSEDDSVTAGTGTDDSKIVAGDSEIWRFILKTDSPHEIRGKVVQILTALKVPANTPGVGGIEAPGGIQFDLLLPKEIVAPIKKQLQSIAPPVPEGMSETPVADTFTWYKNRSKSPIPQGKTRVVIWLSQI